jgi:hypothetical protein
MKKHYGDRIRVMYTDTDSLVFRIDTEDLYTDLQHPDLNDHFDFSNYPKDHPLYSTKNKGVLGKFKDELGGRIMTEFIALRSKMYSFTYVHDGKDIDTEEELDEKSKRGKGIQNDQLQHTVTHENILKYF